MSFPLFLSVLTLVATFMGVMVGWASLNYRKTRDAWQDETNALIQRLLSTFEERSIDSDYIYDQLSQFLEKSQRKRPKADFGHLLTKLSKKAKALSRPKMKALQRGVRAARQRVRREGLPFSSRSPKVARDLNAHLPMTAVIAGTVVTLLSAVTFFYVGLSLSFEPEPGTFPLSTVWYQIWEEPLDSLKLLSIVSSPSLLILLLFIAFSSRPDGKVHAD